jgi:hypothetical protein
MDSLIANFCMKFPSYAAISRRLSYSDSDGLKAMTGGERRENVRHCPSTGTLVTLPAFAIALELDLFGQSGVV